MESASRWVATRQIRTSFPIWLGDCFAVTEHSSPMIQGSEITMSKQLGSVDLVCDAPSYRVVRSCCSLGIRKPEDVRWLRMSSYCCPHPCRTNGLTSYLLAFLTGRIWAAVYTCTCGQALPKLKNVLIDRINTDEEEAIYLLCQCPKCLTVFWDLADSFE